MSNRSVLLLMTDQQRWDTIAAVSANPVIRTPNLDRLCRSGVGFRHAYTPVPICGPARSRLLTGVGTRGMDHETFADKLQWRPNARSLQSTLAQAGYRTGGFGKMHFEPTRDSHGFQFFALHEEVQSRGREVRAENDYFTYLKEQGLGHVRYPCGVRGLLYNQPQISPIPEEHHETKWVADRALEFIDEFHRQPFFCFVSWVQPHWPVHVPLEWANRYDSELMPLPRWTDEEQPHLPWEARLMRRASDIADEGSSPNTARMRRVIALYYASISYIDAQVGRLLDALERHGILDETLILFTSDHGEMLFDHLTIGKVLAYDPSIRVPLIAAGPGMQNAGELSDDFVTLLDVAPTVYAFTGVEPPAGNILAGESLLDDRREIRRREAVFSENSNGPEGGFVCIRTRKWKYAFYHFDGLRQLFDLEKDPHELHNLLLDPQPGHQETARKLHARLLAWTREQSVDSRIQDGDFVVTKPSPIPPDRNSQYEEFIDNLPDDEKAALWSEARSVYEAIKDEPELDVAELDLEYWESKRGPGSIAELEALLGRKLRSG